MSDQWQDCERTKRRATYLLALFPPGQPFDLPGLLRRELAQEIDRRDGEFLRSVGIDPRG